MYGPPPGIDAQVRKHRAGYIYSAIGPVSASDKTKKVPSLGDWDMLRSQTFLGEMKKDRVLFGSPTMKTMREAMRKHVDVMETAKACTEIMLSWIARYEMWSRQVDEYFHYKVLDPKLSAAQNKKRFSDYTSLQRDLHAWQAEAVEHVLRCYGVGKDDISLLAQFTVAAMKGDLGEQATLTMLAGLSGVKVLDGKAIGGEMQPVDSQAQDDPYSNPSLRLMMSSFLEKAAIYKMPQPGMHIPGVPDEDEQETPRERSKRVVREMMLEPKKIQ